MSKKEQKYKVTSPIRHNGKRYEVGDFILLDEETADGLHVEIAEQTEAELKLEQLAQAEEEAKAERAAEAKSEAEKAKSTGSKENIGAETEESVPAKKKTSSKK